MAKSGFSIIANFPAFVKLELLSVIITFSPRDGTNYKITILSFFFNSLRKIVIQ